MRVDRKLKILLVRLSSLGDLVLTTPAISALRAKFPQASISLLTKEGYAQLFSSDPNLDAVIPFDDRGSHQGLLGLFRFVGRLRRERFDILIDLHSNLRSVLISSLSRAGLKLRYSKRILRRFCLLLFKRSGPARHVVDLYLDALAPLEVVSDQRGPRVYLEKECRRSAQELLREKGRSRECLIAIAPGAKWPTKKWPGESFSKLADLLSDRLSADVVIVGDDRDVETSIGVAERMRNSPIQACGETSLGQLAALLESCELLIANDSGPMHLATAVGTPVVAIFGPTVAEFGFTPWGDKNVVISRPLPCKPCSLHGSARCPRGHFLCMKLIEPQEVFGAAVKVHSYAQLSRKRWIDG